MLCLGSLTAPLKTLRVGRTPWSAAGPLAGLRPVDRRGRRSAGGGARPTKACLLIAACLLAGGCSKKEEAEPEPIAPVQVTPARQDSIRRLVQADGVAFPLDQVSVAAKISAPVQKFYVNRGDHVTAGQLLATLESHDLTANAAESQGQLAQAEANLRSTSGASIPEQLIKAQTDVRADTEQRDAAKKLLDSRQKLFTDGALARKQVDEAQVAYAQANAQLETAQEHLKALQGVARDEQLKTAEAQVASAKAHSQTSDAQLSYAEIHSPIAGVISDRPLWPGEMAAAGTPMLTVMDVSRIVARANVPQNQAGFVHVGGSATVTALDGGLELSGKVTVVSAATDPASTTVQVWVQADNPGERLKPGASVRVSIVAATIQNATVVPLSAILPGEEGGTVVAVAGADSLAHLKKVEIGVREPDRVQILSGVAPGERVIVAGGVGLEDKAKIRIVKPGETDEKDSKEK